MRIYFGSQLNDWMPWCMLYEGIRTTLAMVIRLHSKIPETIDSNQEASRRKTSSIGCRVGSQSLFPLESDSALVHGYRYPTGWRSFEKTHQKTFVEASEAVFLPVLLQHAQNRVWPHDLHAFADSVKWKRESLGCCSCTKAAQRFDAPDLLHGKRFGGRASEGVSPEEKSRICD